MRAVKFYGVGKVGIEQIDIPQPKANQALVRIIYGGICGSDLHIYREGMFVDAPGETMGHEFIGRIEQVTDDSGFKVGDLVIADPRVPCLNCIACTTGDYHRCSGLAFVGEVCPGGFADYLVIDTAKLLSFDENTDPLQGAIAEPLAVAIHACEKVVRIEADQALIIGAGPIGLLIAYLLKHQYNYKHIAVADIDSFRSKMALDYCADTIVADLTAIKNQYPVIIDAVGLEVTLNAALTAIAPGGSIYISAIYEKIPQVDINWVVGKELQIYGNNAYDFKDLQKAVSIINSQKHDFSWLVTKVLAPEQAAIAFELLTARTKEDLKILLDFR